MLTSMNNPIANRQHSVRLERFLTARRLRKTSVDDSAAASAAAIVPATSVDATDATVMRAILMRVTRNSLIELQAALQTELEEKWVTAGGVTDSQRFDFAEQAVVLLRNVLDSRTALGETKVAPRSRAVTESMERSTFEAARRTTTRRQATQGAEMMTLRTALATKSAQNAVLEARLASLMEALDDDKEAPSDVGGERNDEGTVFPSSPSPRAAPPPRSSARRSLAVAASNAAAGAAQMEATQLRAENTQLLEQLRALGGGLAGSPRTRLRSNIIALVAQLRDGDAPARDAAAAAGALLHSAAAALRGSYDGAPPPPASPPGAAAPINKLEARNAALEERVRALETERARAYAARCALEEQLAIAQHAAEENGAEAAAGAASTIALRSELLNANVMVWEAEVEAIADDMLRSIAATGAASGGSSSPLGANALPLRRRGSPSRVPATKALRLPSPPSTSIAATGAASEGPSSPLGATALPLRRRGSPSRVYVPPPPSVIVQLVARQKDAQRVFDDERGRAQRRSVEAAAQAVEAAAEAESFAGVAEAPAPRTPRTHFGARSARSSGALHRVARTAAASVQAPRDPFLDRFVFRGGGDGVDSPIAAKVYF